MEASVATPEQAVEHSPAENATPVEMFRYSAYVHVGPGAEACEEGEQGTCSNPLHFHAWCRLPNQHQHASIREKALAAKARKVRQLRDSETDAYVVLETELDAAVGDTEKLIDELVNKHFFRDRVQAMHDLIEEREDFKTIREDQERFAVLLGTPEEQRNADEFNELQKHVSEFTELMEEQVTDRQRPEREALSQRGPDELRRLVRDARIEREASNEFNRVYSLWEQYVCTLRPVEGEAKPTERLFPNVDALQAAAPEVIDALDDLFTEIEAAQAGGATEGN